MVKQIIRYPNSKENPQVNTYFDNGKFYHIKGAMLLKQRRLATTALGKDTLGFTANQIGLHSARSGAAMAMYLVGVPVYTIMLKLVQRHISIIHWEISSRTQQKYQ